MKRKIFDQKSFLKVIHSLTIFSLLFSSCIKIPYEEVDIKQEEAKTTAQVRFRKEGSYSLYTYMGIENVMNQVRVADYYFGSGSGTSNYYSVQAGTYVPTVYSTSYGGWVYFLVVPYDDKVYTASLNAGFRYTIRLYYDSSGYHFNTNNDGSF